MNTARLVNVPADMDLRRRVADRAVVVRASLDCVPSLAMVCAPPLPTPAAGTATETVLLVGWFAAAMATPTIRNSCQEAGVNVKTQAEAWVEDITNKPATA